MYHIRRVVADLRVIKIKKLFFILYCVRLATLTALKIGCASTNFDEPKYNQIYLSYIEVRMKFIISNKNKKTIFYFVLCSACNFNCVEDRLRLNNKNKTLIPQHFDLTLFIST